MPEADKKMEQAKMARELARRRTAERQEANKAKGVAAAETLISGQMSSKIKAQILIWVGSFILANIHWIFIGLFIIFIIVTAVSCDVRAEVAKHAGALTYILHLITPCK